MALQVLQLTEGEFSSLSRERFSESVAKQVYRTPGIDLEFPSPANDFRYRLCSSTLIGQVPVGRDLLIRIAPKVPVSNIFRMLELAYDLPSFHFSEGMVDVETLPDLYERLAGILARRVVDRARRGLYRSYLECIDASGYVRGRVDIRETTRLLRSGIPTVQCAHDEQTSDLPDNQILLWTLSAISRLALSREDVVRVVRSARRVLAGAASLVSFRGADCVGRLYNRLNDDYQPLHSICRFFLENLGPGIARGGSNILPFILNMPALFESYVAKWLAVNAPPGLRVEAQHVVQLDREGELSFRIDLVIFDRATNLPLAVLDTKYKPDLLPDQRDIQQIVAYAVRMVVRHGFLLYPSRLAQRKNFAVGPVLVRSCAFDLNDDLESSGGAVWSAIFADLGL
jgi:5-methylcytosine-specific restriction enzyme subunit McrC